MIPTARLWFFVLLGVPFGALAFQIDQPWLLAVYNLALALAAFVDFKLCVRTSSIKLSRIFDPVLSVRVPNKIRIEIANEGQASIVGRFRDEAPKGCEAQSNEFDLVIEPGRQVERTYNVTPGERGSEYFRGTFARLRCPLGLVDRQHRLKTEQPVRIYPNVLALREFDLLKQKGRLRQIGIRKSRIRGLGMEFESLRDYALGDDYRKIDWKASARRNKLVVRQFETERNQSVVLCIDVGRRMLSEVNGVSKLDHVLDAVLMVAHAAALEGDLVGLLLYADSVKRYIPPRKGKSQVGFIIEALHDVVAEPVETDFVASFGYLGSRNKRRSLLINFTDLDDDDEATQLVESFGTLSKRHLSLVARIGDPQLKEIAQGAILEPRDLFNKSAALMVGEDRRKAGVKLSNAGIHHFECEPQELAAELVSFYFTVKELSLL